jgi:hypothetical protein
MSPGLRRLLSLSKNPAGLLAAAEAVYAAVAMIVNAAGGHGVFSAAAVVAAFGAVAALFTRQLVTPVAEPKDVNGLPLTPAQSVSNPVPPR